MPRPHSHSHSHPSRRGHSNTKSRPSSSKSRCGSLSTWLLSLLATFLLGTVIVLSIVKSFFGVDWNDALDAEEVNYYSSIRTLPYGSSPGSSHSVPTPTAIEKIPRIIHQTWKTTLLPSKWAKLTSQCKALHPDYEYKLWTDESSIEFIKEHYNWFLPTFMNYKLDIQRADVIRYFVLHKYGGVYMDLDIGCRRAMDPLLNFQTILPATKPVGISNDLIFAEPNSPFMDSVIHNLIAFDHYYLSDYPTVMFSTGPMFLSAVLSLWNSSSTYADVSSAPLEINARFPSYFAVSSNNTSNTGSLFSGLTSNFKDSSSSDPFEMQDHLHTVRILPRELYGKNIDSNLVPNSFFYHYYGSSWHQNDSVIFTFLGQFGKTLMNIAFIIVILGTAFIVIRRIKRGSRKGITSSSSMNNNIGNSSGYSRLALDYDSDIEEGNGRCTPPLSSLPLPSSASAHNSRSLSSRRSRRRQYRRAMAAGARHWLFGGGVGSSLINNLTSGKSSSGGSSGGRRRSASTGAISLPVHSSESGSEDALFYTSSSEDGRDTRRVPFFVTDHLASSQQQQQQLRRASVWTEDDDLQYQRDAGSENQAAIAVSSTARTAPPLHRRASSQPGGPSRSNTPTKARQASSPSSSTAGLRTPIPPSYLELPPPPPYRPPSPLMPVSPNSNNNNRSWYSSFFSVIPSPTSPSSASASNLSLDPRSGLPLFSTTGHRDANNTSSNSRTDTSSINSSNAQNFRSDSNLYPQHQDRSVNTSVVTSPHSSAYSHQQDYISHTRQSSLADNEDEERDSDNFSLHSVKARR